MLECLICAESFDKSARKAVKCEYCPSTACRKCCETYILGQTEPHCMDAACMRTWTRKFLSNTFTKVWLSTEYKAHCAQTLYDTERVMFPATQDIIQRERRIQDLSNERERIIEECKRRVRDIEIQLRILRHGPAYVPPYEETADTAAAENVSAVHPCIYDGCRGYMSSQWKCGMCDKHACAHCHKPKAAHTDDSHVCNPDDVASVAAIKKETRPCPRCRAQIYKIHGCDQMWCVNCNTAFSWQKGTVITGPVHNPHYHEYLARTGGHHGARQGDFVGPPHCGYAAVPHVLLTDIRRVLGVIGLDHRAHAKLTDLPRIIQHVAQVEIVQPIPTDQVNIELRKKFLRNEIDETQFKRQSLSNHKANQRNGEICQVAEMVRDALSDIYLRMQSYVRDQILTEQPISRYHVHTGNVWLKDGVNVIREHVYKFVEEIKALHTYANECVENINAVYASASKKRFSSRFELEVPQEK